MRTLCAHHEALWPQMRVVLNWGEKYEVRLRPLSQRVPATGCSCFGFPFSVRLPRLKALAPCSSPLLGNPHRSPPVANPRPRSGPPVKCTRPCGPGGSRSFSLDPAAIVPEEKMASSPKISVLAVISVFCLLPAWLVAGADPAVVRSPAPVHHFFDARNIASFTVNAIVMGTDIATTHQALQVPGAREANPLMKSQAAIIPVKVACVGAGLGLAYMLHRSGHHRAERIIPLFLGVPSALAAVHNAGIHQ